jgi:hypothetical protein
MLFEIDPPHAVGPLRLGMTLAEAHEALATLGTPLWMCLGGRYSVFRDSGLCITPHTRDGLVESVWLEGPPEPGTDDTVTYRGIDLFATPHRQVVDALRHHTTIVAEDHAFVAPDLELTLVLSYDDPDLDAFERVVFALPEPA